MIIRKTWSETWCNIADVVARRSPCERAQVGAVIVDGENRILAVGYNGPPRGSKLECATCPRNLSGGTASYDSCYTVHAELNAFSVVNRAECKGGNLFVTGSMCMTCAKMTINMGIRRVTWNEAGCAHRDPAHVAAFLRQHGVQVIRQWFA